MKVIINVLLSSILFLQFAMFNSVLASEDSQTDEIKKVWVLENISYANCLYSGDVVVQVSYRIQSQDMAFIVVEGTEDGTTFFPFARKEVEKGEGASLLQFTAGDCLADIRVVTE